MIRETPHRTLKQKSRSKPKNPAPPAQAKPQIPVARSSKAESVYQFHPGHPTRLVKNDSKTKIQKIMPPPTKIKPSLSNKNTPDSDALYMKANLKQFISKNAASKSKGTEVVPDLLKNIDKHCKELKQIHDK